MIDYFPSRFALSLIVRATAIRRRSTRPTPRSPQGMNPGRPTAVLPGRLPPVLISTPRPVQLRAIAHADTKPAEELETGARHLVGHSLHCRARTAEQKPRRS